ncbi:protein FAM43B [Sceloporus undulatus]|uniref:protein FAM43B n=1 Tax=Sceloporus undulatus TaxID=8520 RepID=UPI001C4D4CD8|nr:protein FAM43B [Sceloporus undulatus]
MATMLPWRRNKFVLVEDGNGQKSKGKSLGPGLSYGSLLANLIRSCPDLWPECPLQRLGNVFCGKRQKVELNKDDPTYTVWYLGNAVTLQAKGEGCTDDAVEKIWAKSEFGAQSTKMKLTLGPHGIRMNPSEKGARRPSHAYLLHRITYSGANRRRPKVFAWVYRHQVKNKAVVLRCHAVLLSKAEKATAMSLLLGQTSCSAFNEFKRLKRQSDSRHVHQELLGNAIIPLVPLRKLLNCKCPYRPPPERNRSAPRLSSIQEEEEEEEEKKEEEKIGCHSTSGAYTWGASAANSVNRIQVGGIICIERGANTLGGSTSKSILLLRTFDGTTPGHNAATILVPSGRERSEVLSLAQELRFCTLRGPLSPISVPSWEPRDASPCLPC